MWTIAFDQNRTPPASPEPRAARHLAGGNHPVATPAQARPQRAVALDQVSLDVRQGEIFGIVGLNGRGKTRLLRQFAAQRTAARGRFGPAAPGAAFFQKLSPLENLLYGARRFAVRPAEARRRMFAILRQLGLPTDALYRPLEELSRGTQQMVAIARAWLSSPPEPRLLLLDEPTAGLDPCSRRDVQAFIRQLRDQHGATVLLTTCDLLEAEHLCDRVAVVDGGRLVAVDTPAALKQRVTPPAGRPATLEDVFLTLTRQPALAEETNE